jgi:negative regulator of sigma E activity
MIDRELDPAIDDLMDEMDEMNEMDEELSALLDGELTPERARELREEVARDPALQGRLAAFEAVDQRLQSLPRPALASDLRARLQARIDRLEGPPSPTSLASPQVENPRFRRAIPLALALAAGLTVVLLTRPLGNPASPTEQLQVPPSPVTEVTVVVADTAKDPAPAPTPDAALEVEIQDASDEELAIAFELEMLSELDMIWELDLLEALLAMEDLENSGKPISIERFRTMEPMEEEKG